MVHSFRPSYFSSSLLVLSLLIASPGKAMDRQRDEQKSRTVRPKATPGRVIMGGAAAAAIPQSEPGAAAASPVPSRPTEGRPSRGRPARPSTTARVAADIASHRERIQKRPSSASPAAAAAMATPRERLQAPSSVIARSAIAPASNSGRIQKRPSSAAPAEAPPRIPSQPTVGKPSREIPFGLSVADWAAEFLAIDFGKEGEIQAAIAPAAAAAAAAAVPQPNNDRAEAFAAAAPDENEGAGGDEIEGQPPAPPGGATVAAAVSAAINLVALKEGGAGVQVQPAPAPAAANEPIETNEADGEGAWVQVQLAPANDAAEAQQQAGAAIQIEGFVSPGGVSAEDADAIQIEGAEQLVPPQAAAAAAPDPQNNGGAQAQIEEPFQVSLRQMSAMIPQGNRKEFEEAIRALEGRSSNLKIHEAIGALILIPHQVSQDCFNKYLRQPRIKKYYEDLNRERYEHAKRILENPLTTHAEKKQALETLRYSDNPENIQICQEHADRLRGHEDVLRGKEADAQAAAAAPDPQNNGGAQAQIEEPFEVSLKKKSAKIRQADRPQFEHYIMILEGKADDLSKHEAVGLLAGIDERESARYHKKLKAEGYYERLNAPKFARARRTLEGQREGLTAQEALECLSQSRDPDNQRFYKEYIAKQERDKAAEAAAPIAAPRQQNNGGAQGAAAAAAAAAAAPNPQNNGGAQAQIEEPFEVSLKKKSAKIRQADRPQFEHYIMILEGKADDLSKHEAVGLLAGIDEEESARYRKKLKAEGYYERLNAPKFARARRTLEGQREGLTAQEALECLSQSRDPDNQRFYEEYIANQERLKAEEAAAAAAAVLQEYERDHGEFEDLKQIEDPGNFKIVMSHFTLMRLRANPNTPPDERTEATLLLLSIKLGRKVCFLTDEQAIDLADELNRNFDRLPPDQKALNEKIKPKINALRAEAAAAAAVAAPLQHNNGGAQAAAAAQVVAAAPPQHNNGGAQAQVAAAAAAAAPDPQDNGKAQPQAVDPFEFTLGAMSAKLPFEHQSDFEEAIWALEGRPSKLGMLEALETLKAIPYQVSKDCYNKYHTRLTNQGYFKNEAAAKAAEAEAAAAAEAAEAVAWGAAAAWVDNGRVQAAAAVDPAMLEYNRDFELVKATCAPGALEDITLANSGNYVTALMRMRKNPNTLPEERVGVTILLVQCKLAGKTNLINDDQVYDLFTELDEDPGLDPGLRRELESDIKPKIDALKTANAAQQQAAAATAAAAAPDPQNNGGAQAEEVIAVLRQQNIETLEDMTAPDAVRLKALEALYQSGDPLYAKYNGQLKREGVIQRKRARETLERKSATESEQNDALEILKGHPKGQQCYEKYLLILQREQARAAAAAAAAQQDLALREEKEERTASVLKAYAERAQRGH